MVAQTSNILPQRGLSEGPLGQEAIHIEDIDNCTGAHYLSVPVHVVPTQLKCSEKVWHASVFSVVKRRKDCNHQHQHCLRTAVTKAADEDLDGIPIMSLSCRLSAAQQRDSSSGQMSSAVLRSQSLHLQPDSACSGSSDPS